MYKKKVGTKNPTFLIIWNKNKNYKEMRNKIGYFIKYKSIIYDKGKFFIWNDWK